MTGFFLVFSKVNFAKKKITEDSDFPSQFQTKINVAKRGFPVTQIAWFFYFFLGLYIQYWKTKLVSWGCRGFATAHLVPASPAVPIPARHSPVTPKGNPLPWGSLRPFCMVPATAWRKPSGKGWETLYPDAYCTLKSELANTGLAPTMQLVIVGLQRDVWISIPIHVAKHENFWANVVSKILELKHEVTWHTVVE